MWIQIDTYHNALAFSLALYKLQVPVCDNPRDPTCINAALCEHPGGPQKWQYQGQTIFWIDVPDFWLCEDADPHGLDGPLQPWVDAGAMSEAELVAMQDAIRDNRGGTVNMSTFVPQYWRNTEITTEQARDLGYPV